MTDDPASKDGLRWEIRRSLIERLRIPLEGMGDMANQQRAEAAIQISTMMDEIEAWRQAMQKAERDIAQVRAERDEARKTACEWGSKNVRGAKLIAQIQGWDCFKENA